ncbi:MAG: ribonuclease HII [Deltaproteobacteria bacterium]|nr:ribonuclease HII [Deltaproteobacteria bacterium]
MGPDELEAWAEARGYHKVAGVDEVGRGPLAGPVVAAAVILPKDHGIDGLDDSKKLTPKKREVLAEAVRDIALAWGLAEVDAARIDATNIRLASLEAMGLAFVQMLAGGLVPDVVLVDGRDVFPFPSACLSVPIKAFPKADGRSRNVAAASIVAKVHRDALMATYHKRWPVYGFDGHKGYPTAKHRKALSEHGPCSIHRLSFRGVLP